MGKWKVFGSGADDVSIHPNTFLTLILGAKKMSREDCLVMGENITHVLLIHAQREDCKRWFAGIRKPSKVTISLWDDLIKIYEERKALVTKDNRFIDPKYKVSLEEHLKHKPK